VRLELKEASELAAQLNITVEKFIEEFTDSRWPSENSYLIRRRNGACIFLSHWKDAKITGCKIHSFRPKDCRDWVAGLNKPECCLGLADWDLTVGSSGSLCGTAESMERFRLYIETL